MMDILTNEKFRNKFKNNFDLVNYAIEHANVDSRTKSLQELMKELEQLPDIEKKV